MTGTLDDVSLIERVRQGNAHAYGLLVQRYQRYAYTLALRVVRDPMVAEEVAQDAFVQAYRALDSFEGTAKFSTWLYRIVLNAALATQRKKKRPQTPEMPTHLADTVQASDDLLGKERRAYLEQGLAELSEKDRTLLTLYYFQELSLEEMAEVVAQPVNTVKVQVHRARARLARVLEKLMKEEIHSLL